MQQPCLSATGTVLSATELFAPKWLILCNVTIACIKVSKKEQKVVERSSGLAGSNQLIEGWGRGDRQLLRAGRGSGLSSIKYKGLRAYNTRDQILPSTKGVLTRATGLRVITLDNSRIAAL